MDKPAACRQQQTKSHIMIIIPWKKGRDNKKMGKPRLPRGNSTTGGKSPGENRPRREIPGFPANAPPAPARVRPCQSLPDGAEKKLFSFFPFDG